MLRHYLGEARGVSSFLVFYCGRGDHFIHAVAEARNQPTVLAHSFIARRRAVITRMRRRAKNGVCGTMNRKRRSSIGITTEGLMARTVALLGLPSTKAIPPRIPPAETLS